ncbi:MAG: flagellar hook basal-body protein [Phycisphaeraceae bacterium]|nr:flagellar hook basal-body protein [Phycisphaeraceae bacterium]
MSYGLQISAGGVAAALYRQDVHANNLANMDTVGYKPDRPQQLFRSAVRQEDALPHMPSDALLERLGGGVLMRPNLVDVSPSSLRPTSNPLDLAVEGDGYFVLEADAAQSGKENLLTRDGRFTRDRAGRLVSAGTGRAVLDHADRPIILPSGGEITVSGDGAVRRDGQVMARIKVVTVDRAQQLRKVGHTMFAAPAAEVRSDAARTGQVKQGMVETSGVSQIRTLMDLTSASREVDANISMIQAHDKLVERAINSLGRLNS